MMKDMFQMRASENARSRVNPFYNMLRNMIPPEEMAYKASGTFTPSTPESRSRTNRQDRPSAATGAFDNKYGWKTGMEKARVSDAIGLRYARGQRQRDGGWAPGDANTTRKQPAPASMAKQNKPTATDALSARRETAINKNAYFSPEMQRMADQDQQRSLREAKAFERGLEIAKRRQKL